MFSIIFLACLMCYISILFNLEFLLYIVPVRLCFFFIFIGIAIDMTLKIPTKLQNIGHCINTTKRKQVEKQNETEIGKAQQNKGLIIISYQIISEE